MTFQKGWNIRTPSIGYIQSLIPTRDDFILGMNIISQRRQQAAALIVLIYNFFWRYGQTNCAGTGSFRQTKSAPIGTYDGWSSNKPSIEST